MDVPDDDWDIRPAPFSSSAGDDTSRETSTSFSRKKREQHLSWLTPASTNAQEKKKKMENKKNNDGEKKKKIKKINETKKKEEESDARAKPILEASGRLLGRRRRAKEKRKRMAMMRRRGGGGSEEEDEDEDERKKSAKTEDQRKKKEKNETTTEMTEKQKRKAEKNRARKLRREWKRKKEMEEKNARGGGGGGEKEEEEDDDEEEEANGKELPNEEERKEMKRLAKDYVAEKAKKRAKSASTAGGGEKEEEEDDGGRSSGSGGESSEKEGGSSDESEDDVAPQQQQQQQQQPVAKKKLSLIDKMRAKLSGGHFRMLNEQLYTTKGDEALHLVQQNPGVFDAYHEGFREQVKKWPKNPVHKCFEWLQHKPYDTVIADFGCGDAELAKLIGTSKKKVYSLDLETPSHAPFVIACNMAKTPLESNSVDVAVFSLSLMGTDYYKFIEEASRVLKVRGILWIAEVKSRFDGKNGAASVSSFIASLKTAGFDVNPKKVDEKDKMFFVLEAVKTKNMGTGGDENINENKKKRASGGRGGRVEWPKLKACEYKKR